MKPAQITQEEILHISVFKLFNLLDNAVETKLERALRTQAKNVFIGELFESHVFKKTVKDFLYFEPQKIRNELELNGRVVPYGKFSHKLLSDFFISAGFSLGSYPFLISSWKEATDDDFKLPKYHLEDWLPQPDEVESDFYKYL